MEGKGENKEWRVLEFYSGIGGLRYSLVEAGIDARVVEAFDINDKANDVYSHNFGHRPYQGNIQSLSATDLDNYGAHAWLLSPPCQPYTRQGLKKHSGDVRAFSFLRILELIPQTSRLPIMLFVENVVGFETSDTHAKMIETLTKSDFVTQEFILNPIQFGVPYSRPRYFCLAKRKPFCFQNQALDNKLQLHPSPLLLEDGDPETDACLHSAENIQKLLDSCQPIKQFLESESATHEQYMVPVELIERWGSAMDIVYPGSRRCCCFTKSYYRYVKGTGSLLATNQLCMELKEVRPSHMQPSIKGENVPLKDQSLRYFTPREVANLHSFPRSFEFPDSISLKQRYALLGNSLSITVVAPLLRYLFAGS